MTSMLSDMLQSSLSKFASKFWRSGRVCLHRMWLQLRAQGNSRDSMSHSQVHDVSNTSQTRPVITWFVAGSVYKISTVRSQIRSDSEINPGPTCESGSLPSPGVSRSWSRSRSRPTSCWFSLTI